MKYKKRSLAHIVMPTVRAWLVLVAITVCPLMESYSAPIAKELTIFCGFKAGEKKQNIKFSRGDDIYPDAVRCRTPFRKFRNARLFFSTDDRLEGLCAVTFIKGMKPNGGKTELDKCCSELAKYGIIFPKEWRDDGAGHLSKSGRGPGVNSVRIEGNIQCTRHDERGKEQKGVLIIIDIGWDLTPPVTPKIGRYNPQGGLSRQKFVENAFGVTFGTEIAKSIELVERDKKSIELVKGVNRRLTEPVCEMQHITFLCDNGNVVKGISLRHGYETKDLQMALQMAKHKFTKVCAATQKWLGIDELRSEDPKDIAEMFANDDIQGKSITAKFEDDDVRVVIEASVLGKKGTNYSTTYYIEIFPKK